MLLKNLGLSIALLILVVPSSYGQLIVGIESAEGGENNQITDNFDDQDCDCYTDLDCSIFQGCDIGSH